MALLLACALAPLHAAEPVPSSVPMVALSPQQPIAVTTTATDEVELGLLRQVKGAVQDTLQSGVGWLAGGNSEPLVLQQGVASYLANSLHGRKTASGERYDMNELTAAHKTLPFGTRVIVRSLQTGREVAVRITDRGPHIKSRIIDLSHAAAVALGIKGHGVAEVQLVEQSATPKPAAR